MKNFIRTLAFALMFVFSMSSFSNSKEQTRKNQTLRVPPCDQQATMNTDWYIMHSDGYYDNDAYAGIWMAYYLCCIS